MRKLTLVHDRSWPLSHHRLQGLPVGGPWPRGSGPVVLDCSRARPRHRAARGPLRWYTVVHADHDQAAASVLLVETVQGRRGGAADGKRSSVRTVMQRSLAILEAKRPYALGQHRDKTLGDRRIEGWEAPGADLEGLLDTLVASDLVDPAAGGTVAGAAFPEKDRQPCAAPCAVRTCGSSRIPRCLGNARKARKGGSRFLAFRRMIPDRSGRCGGSPCGHPPYRDSFSPRRRDGPVANARHAPLRQVPGGGSAVRC